MGKFKVLRKADGDTVTDPNAADPSASLAVDPSVASADGLNGADIPDLMKQIQDSLATSKATHAQQNQAAKDYLIRMQSGPSAGERLMQIGSSLVAPMQMRGLAGMLNNVGPVMAKQAADVRTAADDRAKQLMLLQRQYGTDTLADDKEALNYSLKIAQLKAAQEAKLAAAGNAKVWDTTLGRFIPKSGDAVIHNRVTNGKKVLDYASGNMGVQNPDGTFDVYSPADVLIGHANANGDPINGSPQ